MKTFRLSAHVTVSAVTEVEAETLEEAIKRAGYRSVEFDQPGADIEDSWLVSDFDGEPHKITEIDND